MAVNTAQFYDWLDTASTAAIQWYVTAESTVYTGYANTNQGISDGQTYDHVDQWGRSIAVGPDGWALYGAGAGAVQGAAGQWAYGLQGGQEEWGQGGATGGVRPERGGDHPVPGYARGIVDAAWLRRRHREEAKAAKLAAAARRRAYRLLSRHLTREQRRTWKENSYFEVQGKSGGQYRLYNHESFNVYKLVDGKEVAKYCAYPRGVPVGDVLLAQKLMLESSEQAFLGVANRHAFHGGL